MNQAPPGELVVAHQHPLSAGQMLASGHRSWKDVGPLVRMELDKVGEDQESPLPKGTEMPVRLWEQALVRRRGVRVFL